MEPEVRKAPVRFYEIDLFRFLAALTVVLFHDTFRGHGANSYTPLSFPELTPYTRYGFLGVQLFFIISGYVVLLSAQGKTIRQFFLSRVTRLYPAFWVACTLTFLFLLFFGRTPADTQIAKSLEVGFVEYLYNMTMLQELFGQNPIDGVYWTLTIEMTFYFLIAVLIGFQLMRYVEWVLLAWLVYTALVGFAAGNAFLPILLPRYAPFFAAGMLFYLLQQPGGRTKARFALLAFAYVLALKQTHSLAWDMTTSLHDDISRKVCLIIITVYFLAIGGVAFRKINLSRFTWLATLGALTYPLYLLHNNITFFAFHRFGHLVNKYVALVLSIAIMLLLAYLIHVLVEKRLSKPLGRLVSRVLDKIAEKSPQLNGHR
jgi:peptidoglycan/LPS O-acetylase OafA/YrhL